MNSIVSNRRETFAVLGNQNDNTDTKEVDIVVDDPTLVVCVLLHRDKPSSSLAISPPLIL